MTLRSGFTLGDWTIHPLEGRLVCDDDERRIQPKSMDVLLCLAGAGGAVVERDKLLREVWGERAQSDEPLTRCIGELRRALGETGAEPAYILTVPKRGYQLLKPVAPLHRDRAAADDETTPKLSESQSQKRLGTLKKVGATVAVLLLAAVVEVLIERALEDYHPNDATDDSTIGNAVSAPRLSIAVLPFVNISSDVEQEYFSDGISEELMNLLTKIPKLHVTSRWSSFSYKGKDIDISDVAAQLNVAHVLTGAVRRDGDLMRITVQLIDVQADTQIWSEIYERELGDIFVTQDEIAAAVVAQLKIKLHEDAPTVVATDPEAYSLVLQARFVAQQFNPDALEKSMRLIEQALAIDPKYAAAWDGMARVYIDQAGQGMRPGAEGYGLGREAANRALIYDPSYAPAHARLGWIARSYDRDFQLAARHYERALALEPTNTIIISNAANFLRSLDRMDDAIALAKYAAVRDPVSPLSNRNLGLIYLYAGYLDEAIESFATTLALSPDQVGAHYFAGSAMLLNGEPESALVAMQSEPDEGWRLIGLAMVYHALGQSDESDKVLEELIEKYEEDAAYNIAHVMAFRGETDRAFDWLDKAVRYNDSGLSGVSNNALFANIRSDPRWKPFLKLVGKAPEQLAVVEFNVSIPD